MLAKRLLFHLPQDISLERCNCNLYSNFFRNSRTKYLTLVSYINQNPLSKFYEYLMTFFFAVAPQITSFQLPSKGIPEECCNLQKSSKKLFITFRSVPPIRLNIFQFFETFYLYMSNPILINQSQHHIVHKICNLLVYHILRVVTFCQQIVLILMCSGIGILRFFLLQLTFLVKISPQKDIGPNLLLYQTSSRGISTRRLVEIFYQMSSSR